MINLLCQYFAVIMQEKNFLSEFAIAIYLQFHSRGYAFFRKVLKIFYNFFFLVTRMFEELEGNYKLVSVSLEIL